MTTTAPRRSEENNEHDKLVASMTGGMVRDIAPFRGSERLRPDGRPRPELRAQLREIPNARNALTTMMAFAMPVALAAAVITVGTWWAVVVAIPFMAVLQNRIMILHHEAAHRLLFSNRSVNDYLGINIAGLVVFGNGSHGYRRGHANHHRDEFGPKEPDFILYSFYPIKTDSVRRKFRRDITGVSAYKLLKPKFTGLFKAQFRKRSVIFFLGQFAVFAAFAVSGHPLYYVWLWVVPWTFLYHPLNRVRAVAEHGGMTRSHDRRLTTHHVRQTLLNRATLAPIGVGYHLAHHVDSGIPFRNLARFQKILEEDGYCTPEITWPSYRALWKELAAG